MIIFHYNSVTKEFVGSSSAFESPLEPGVFLIPANATSIEPPADIPANKVVIFNDNKWEFVDDHRGEIWWIDHSTPFKIQELGNPLDLNYSKTQPEKPPYIPTIQDYSNSIQQHIDATAKAKQYNDAVSLVSYVNSTNTQWKSEAETFIAWRDSVWSYAFDELQKVQQGIIQAPTIEEFINSLPKINW